MGEPAELELVRKAIASHTTGDCEWHERAAERALCDPELQGLTPDGIKKLLEDFVNQGGPIQQVSETRPQYSDRRFYYKVILPLNRFKHGLFVEIILVDDDPKDPAVQIVNAHEQKH